MPKGEIEMRNLMTRIEVVAGLMLVLPLLYLLPLAAMAESGTDNGIARCASVNDASDRLACYDKLVGRQESSPATVVLPAKASPPVAAPPDELGAEALGRKEEKKDDDEAPVEAKVIRCVKDARKDYHFYLEGGQVWKQLSDKKLYYKECEFNVTISRDYFGYKMQIEGEKSRLRVKRIR